MQPPSLMSLVPQPCGGEHHRGRKIDAAPRTRVISSRSTERMGRFEITAKHDLRILT